MKGMKIRNDQIPFLANTLPLNNIKEKQILYKRKNTSDDQVTGCF